MLYIPKAHDDRINQIIEHENLLFSCSDDGYVKIWDFRETCKKPVNYLKNQSEGKQNEIFSIDIQGRILAGGINESI